MNRTRTRTIPLCEQEGYQQETRRMSFLIQSFLLYSEQSDGTFVFSMIPLKGKDDDFRRALDKIMTQSHDQELGID